MYNVSRPRGRVGGRGFLRGGPPLRGGGRGRGGSREYYHGHGRPIHAGPRPGPGPGPGQGQDPDRLLSALGPEAKLALTQALVATVLNQEGQEGRSGGYRDDRDGSYRSYRDMRREGRGGYKEDYHPREQQRRHFGDDRSRPYHQHPRYEGVRSYREEERGQGRPRYERDGKPPMGTIRQRTNYHKYVGPTKRRSSPHDHLGASNKRQRLEEFDARESPRREVENMDEEQKEPSSAEEGEPKDKPEAAEGGTDGGPSGVQVTICADGERNVNSEGHARSRVAGFLYVELRCPHCPGQHSITFKEYKYHLGSSDHKNQLGRLARKHSLVLRKIRVQQRQEQKDIEAKWREEKPEEFQNAVTRFCNTCKLAFKYLGHTNEGISRHNRSKLHRMQRHYLHPRCGTCRITFPTRMVYEHHMCSINHLRVRSAMLEKYRGSRKDGDSSRDEMEYDNIDLDNFMTLDSVGEDDDEVGSEHEEITGGLDAAEIAEDLAAGEEDMDGTKKRGDVSLAWEKLQLGDDDEEEEEDQQPLGTDYVRRVQAYFCNLCHRIIRGDSSHGVSPVRKHCRGVTHISHYNELHPPEQSEDEESGGEGDHKAEDGKKAEEAEGKAVDVTKEEEGDREEEAEGEEEEEGEGEEQEEETEADHKEAEQNEQVEDDEEPKEEEEEMEDEEVEGMAEDKEEGWDEEVGDDFAAP